MKRYFEEAELELVKIAPAEDIITSSPSGGSGSSDEIGGEEDPF